jgi:ABC-type taurine transport system substrate-binding protein
MSEFQNVLQRLIATSGKSITEIAQLSGVDRSYIKRLRDGEKVNPSPEQVAKIWLGICMDRNAVRRDVTFVHGLDDLLLALGLTRLADLTNGRSGSN